MRQVTTGRTRRPVSDEGDHEVVEFRNQFEGRSALDEIVRHGAQKMLQAYPFGEPQWGMTADP